ncbi:MAG: bifunctional methylenetetrahydrofolate dehydrogenase/methenyltetrahydrofolate cyclohydrolase, partial [Chlamydiales bacterium]
MILSGKAVAEEIQKEIKETVASLPSSPGLAVVLVGDHPSSHSYVKRKQKACSQVGIRSFVHHLSEKITEGELLEVIRELNQDENIDGILVQLPLPSHIPSLRVIELIDPKKDVDGFHPLNMGKLLLGLEEGFI